MEPMSTEYYKGYKIEICYDDLAPDSPRDWCNLGTMVCWHGRYSMGDKHDYATPGAWLAAMVQEYTEGYSDGATLFRPITSVFKAFMQRQRALGERGDHVDYDYFIDALYENFPPAMEEAMARLDKYLYILPVNMYEHSGVALSTGNGYPFCDPWDSGQAGWIYVDIYKIREEYKVKRVTKEIIERVDKVLSQEVDTYGSYMNGEVYGYVIYEWTDEEPYDDNYEYDDEEEFWEQGDSCWGYIGDSDLALTEARGLVDYMVAQKEKEAA